MTLNDYQKAAERTSGNLTSWDKVRNGCYGLNGEAGECIDILKKTEFQGHDFDPMKWLTSWAMFSGMSHSWRPAWA